MIINFIWTILTENLANTLMKHYVNGITMVYKWNRIIITSSYHLLIYSLQSLCMQTLIICPLSYNKLTVIISHIITNIKKQFLSDWILQWKHSSYKTLQYLSQLEVQDEKCMLKITFDNISTETGYKNSCKFWEHNSLGMYSMYTFTFV